MTNFCHISTTVYIVTASILICLCLNTSCDLAWPSLSSAWYNFLTEPNFLDVFFSFLSQKIMFGDGIRSANCFWIYQMLYLFWFCQAPVLAELCLAQPQLILFLFLSIFFAKLTPTHQPPTHLTTHHPPTHPPTHPSNLESKKMAKQTRS